MQSVFEQLCRCFGSTPINHDMMDMETMSLAQSHVEAGSAMRHQQQQLQQRHGRQQQKSVPATPDMKRRTRSLALQDKQWDALFSPDPNASAACTTRTAAEQPRQYDTSNMPPAEQRAVKTNYELAVEQAHAVAKAKLAANPIRIRSQAQASRKRSRSSSRDDIFRSKRQGRDQTAGPAAGPTGPNPLGRFLSNHPGIAQSLCFATPVRDPEDEPDEVPLDGNSVVSGNTLNTAEDTITSTLYYETTKLAGLHQKSPPMPLFNNFQVEPSDDINRIVASHSHSSAKLIDLVRESGMEVVDLHDDDDEDPTPPASPNRPTYEDLEHPPPMEQMSSSDSSQKSARS